VTQPSSMPVIIEASLNGGTPKSVNPNVPRTPAEIAADAIRCIDAGASMVHTHTDDPVSGGSGVHDPAPYLEAWRPIIEARPGTLLFPTAPVGQLVPVEDRFSHSAALAAAGVLAQAPVDPGSTNIGRTDAEGLPPDSDRVYSTNFRDARWMIERCRELQIGISVSIFEPGFLRFILAYHHAGRLPPGVMIKLYFSADPLLFGLPPTIASLEAYLQLLNGTGLPWLVSAFGGDVVGCGLAEEALRRGGHVQVGIEPFGGDRQPTNLELVEEAVALAKRAGRPVATSLEAAAILGIPGR
jgi:3-keto-5-aminohexanoate cleavage enzyme